MRISWPRKLVAGLWLAVLAGLALWLTLPYDSSQRERLQLGDAALLAAMLRDSGGPTDADADSAVADERDVNELQKPFAGDWPQIRERRVVRVAVPYSRTFYYNDNGRTRGISADLLSEFETYLNRTLKTGRNPITVLAIPVTRDLLLPAVDAGLADIAVGNLTITPEREQLVDFIAVESMQVNEIIVAAPGALAPAREADLAGQTIAVRRSSSYYNSLQALNDRLKVAGLTPVKIQVVPEELEDEDILELVDTNLIPLTVMDDWKVTLWQSVMPNLQPQPGIVLRAHADIGWAVRKNSPELTAIIDGFRQEAERRALGRMKLTEYQQRIAQLKPGEEREEWLKVQQTLALFERYGDEYGFDHLLLLAQGYQESRLNPRAHNASGAIGIMQVLPSTGRAMRVGDIHDTEANIHAGVKYLRQLHDENFADDAIDPVNQTLFSFAAYNAGPSAIARMRRIAERDGFDPNRWFGHVEVVTARRIGSEPVRYVRNIVKYYVSYRQLMARHAARVEALARMPQPEAPDDTVTPPEVPVSDQPPVPAKAG